jgi:hypothetical protein
MSDPNLSIQRQIQGLQFDIERIRKADTGLSAGAAFPSTPGTNLLFYRSDLGLAVLLRRGALADGGFLGGSLSAADGHCDG